MHISGILHASRRRTVRKLIDVDLLSRLLLLILLLLKKQVHNLSALEALHLVAELQVFTCEVLDVPLLIVVHSDNALELFFQALGFGVLLRSHRLRVGSLLSIFE